jgi:hypothetical protein
MIKNLAEIKELLAAKKQGFGGLVDSEGCLCIEGVFALAWGGEIEYRVDHAVVFIDGVKRSTGLDPNMYEEFDFPYYISLDFVKKIGLSAEQEELINSSEYLPVLVSSNPLKLKNYSFLWFELNDNIRLAFEQFSQLLDLINSESMEAQ